MTPLYPPSPFRRARRWAGWLLGCLALVSWGQDTPLAATNYQVQVEWPEAPEAARELLWLVMRAEPLIRRLTDGQPAGVLLRYQSSRSAPVRLGNQLLLPPPARGPGFGPAIVRQLLHRRAQAWRGDLAYPLAAIPDWLVAALLNRVYQEADGPMARPYASYRALLNAGRQPSLHDLLDQPVAPHWPEFYQLYGECGAGLLRLVQQADRQVLVTLLGKTRAASPPSEALAEALAAQGLGEPAALQAWFSRQLPRLVYRLDQPSDYEFVHETLRELLTIRLFTPGADGEFGFRQVPLEDLALYVRDTARPEIPWEQVRRDLLALAIECPPLTRPAVLAHLKALETLRAGKTDKYRTELAAAQQLLAEATKQGLAIRAWLAERERVLYSARHRLGPLAQPILHASSGSTHQDAIGAYLDTLAHPPREP